MTDDHVVHGCPTFSGKELQLVLWAGSLAAHVKITISGTPTCLNHCNFCSVYIYIYITDVTMGHTIQPSRPQVGHHWYRIINMIAILDMACCLRLKKTYVHTPRLKNDPQCFGEWIQWQWPTLSKGHIILVSPTPLSHLRTRDGSSRLKFCGFSAQVDRWYTI